jgi:hypothetical protein
MVTKKVGRLTHDTEGDSVKIRYSQRAVKQLKAISKGDKKSAALILAEVGSLCGEPAGCF